MPAVTRGGMGPWLADIAANVLAITLLVLIALGRLTASDPATAPAEALQPRPVLPLGGAAAVELLRQRLLPGTSGYLDVSGDLAATAGPVAVLFILDPALYPEAIAKVPTEGPLELTIPQALKTADNRWDPAFLALASVADDPERFRTALQILLVEGGDRAGNEAAALSGAPPSTRFQLWFNRALDGLGLLALGLALWGLTRLRRWGVRA